MQRVLKLTVRASMLLLAALFTPAPSISAAAPRTVEDYFLLLPDRHYFEIRPRSEVKRLLHDNPDHFNHPPIIDLRNDYLYFPGDGAQPTLTVALFRHAGRVTVAVYHDFEEGGLDFLRYENGRWRNVTKAVMPVRYNEYYYYHIPRYGTTIRVDSGRDWKWGEDTGKGKPVYDLVWNRGRFLVRPIRHSSGARGRRIRHRNREAKLPRRSGSDAT